MYGRASSPCDLKHEGDARAYIDPGFVRSHAEQIMPKNTRRVVSDTTSTSNCSLARKRRRRVEMADGNGQGVSRIGRFWNLIQVEQARDHMLDLLLLGLAVTDYRGLDGKWRILSDFQTRDGCGQHSDSTYLAQLESRFYVDGVEHVFDGNVIRPVFLDEQTETVKNYRQPPRKRFTRREFDSATGEASEPFIGAQFDDPKARVLSAAIDAENSHARESILVSRVRRLLYRCSDARPRRFSG